MTGPGDRAQPGRRATGSRRWPTPRCWRPSPTPTSRPSWAATTSSSTSRPRPLPGDSMLELEKMLRASLDHAEAQGQRDRRGDHHDRHPADAAPEHFETEWMSANPRYQALDEAVFAARREDLELDITGPDRRAPADVRRHHRAGVGLHLGAAAPAGLARPTSRPTGTPPRRWPARSWRSARTRRSCSASGSGPRPGPSCSCRPPTPARSSCGTRACGRRCSSASGGSPRSSTCSRRTSGTSRRCCRRPPTRTRRRCWPPARRRGCRSCGCTTAPSTGGTGRSTTSSTAARTCGWRTGCCRPGRPSSTCWPTRPSTTAR